MSREALIADIIGFVESVGIPTVAEPVADSALLPGVTIRGGALVYDPALPWPGDLLHEAGHVAVTDPALRPGLDDVPSDPGEEMAAIAWSYAAALAIGIDPAIVFHDHGYRGGGGYLTEVMAAGGSSPGVPMLQYYGMSAEPHQASALGLAPFPAMTRWLR